MGCSSYDKTLRVFWLFNLAVISLKGSVMANKNGFVSFKTVDHHNKLSDELLFIRPEDVKRLSPSGIAECTVVYVYFSSYGVGELMYVVQGNTTEVHKKLYGEPEAHETMEFWKKAYEDCDKSRMAYYEENIRLKDENNQKNGSYWLDKHRELNNQYTELSRQHQALKEQHKARGKDQEHTESLLKDMTKRIQELEKTLQSITVNPCIIIPLN